MTEDVSSQFACLTYHKVGEEEDQYTTSEARLRAQFSFLRAQGYRAEGFEELNARLHTRGELPDRYAVLTFDDGDLSAMHAADLLEEYGFKATFFITRDRCLHKPGFIRTPQVQALRRRGFSLGTHGTTHRKLTRMTVEECRKELAESRAWLEDVIGAPIYFTAAPGGFISTRVLRLVAEQGYRMLGTCSERMNTVQKPRGLQVVRRVNIRRGFSMASFRRILEGHAGFYLCRQLRSAALWLPKQLLPA